MKKILKENIRKIMSLILVASMVMTLDLSVFAQDIFVSDDIILEEIIQDEIIQDEIIQEEITQDEIIQDEIFQDEFVQEEIIQEKINQDDIIEDDIASDETVIGEDIQNDAIEVEMNNELIEEDIVEESGVDEAEVGALGDVKREEEEAREREAMPSSSEYLNKFLTYLKLKYPSIGIDPKFGASGGDKTQNPDDALYNLYNATKMARQKAYDRIEIDGNDTFEGYSDLTKDMVQFKYLGNFGESIGSDEYGNSVYSDTVKTLIIRNVDEIRNLYVPASVETLIIENTTLNCYKYSSDSPGFQSGMNPGDLKNCTNLKKLVIKNVKFGDNYKRGDAANLLPAITYNCPYETNYVLNLQNCQSLEELEIDVSFDGAQEVQLTIDGGTNNAFSNLTDEKCSINPAPGIGYSQVNLYANKNSYLAKRYNSSETVMFKNGKFRLWLLEAIGVDSNNDGVISQTELDDIKTLIINDQTAHSAKQTSLSAFQELADIRQMHGLKTLELDFYDQSSGNRQILKGIDFPDSLENLTMKNIYWEKDTQTKSHENADIVLTNLRTLEMYNTKVKTGSNDSYFNHPTRIKLTDTDGVLQSCIIEKTDVESIELVNNSNRKGIQDQDEKQRIRFSASDCQNLKSVEFLGEGYAVEGSLDLTNDNELTHIGIPNEARTQWTVLGEFDSTYAPINVILNGCSKLGSECNEIVIDYDFINGRDLNVQTMNTDFDESKKLIIKRQPRIDEDRAGNVYLSCDTSTWVYNKYKEEPGFVIENRSSFPTIAVFANGQRIRTSGEGNHNSDSKYTEDSDCWVERWNLVMSPGGYSNSFGNIAFYVIDKVDANARLRKVFYKGDVYVEWEQQDDADSIITLPTAKDETTGEYKLIGSKLSSTGKPGEVELKLYVYNDNGDKSYIGYQNIKIFKMPNSVELVNDGTKRGSGTKEDPYIIYKDEELKLKSRLLVNGEVDRSGDYALRDVYWRIKEYDESPKYTSDSDGYSLYTLDSATKAGISVVRGKLEDGETEAQYDRRTDNIGVNGSDPAYYNHRRFNFDTARSKFKIVAQSPYKYNIDGSDSVISSEVYVEYRNSVAPVDVKPSPSPTPVAPTTVTPTPVAPTTITPTPVSPTIVTPTPVAPEKPALDEPFKDEKNSGKYIMPDPTKNEVVYIAPPSNGKKTINIPDKITVDGKVIPVVKIGPKAFKNNKNVKTINVGKNIKVIDSGAFEGATNLTKISLGKNVKVIGDRAFKNCTKLTTVTIPSTTTKIGARAFEGDKKLKKVTIGKNVESIGDGAFKDCKVLTSISLPSKTKKIGVGAFKGCSKLKTIKITSKKLTSKTISTGAFNGLTSKTTIKVPKSKLKEYKKLFKKKKINSKVIIKGY